MNLKPVEQCSLSEAVMRHSNVGPFELGPCMNFDRKADCKGWVVDDGTGYADLDGPPFQAYVCSRCAARILKTNQGEASCQEQ